MVKTHLAPAAIIAHLRQTGKELGDQLNPNEASIDQDRLDKCVAALEELGGAAKIVVVDGETQIASESCPFAEAVKAHPEVCQVAEAMVQEVTGRPVKEACDRTGSPRCRFVIDRA